MHHGSSVRPLRCLHLFLDRSLLHDFHFLDELSFELAHQQVEDVVGTVVLEVIQRDFAAAADHAEQAVRSAQQARLTGSVTIGLAPTTAAMLGLANR